MKSAFSVAGTTRTCSDPSLTSWCWNLFATVFLLGLFLTVPSMAQVVEATQAFDNGTQALNQGEYSKAIGIFESAELLGLRSPGLYYNRAVAHFRQDEIGKALQYLYKARLLAPEDPSIQHSISIASARMEDQISELPAPVWKRLQRAITAKLSVNSMIALGIGFNMLFAALLVLHIRQLTSGVWVQRLRRLSLFLAICFLFGGFTSAIWPAYPEESVVIVRELSVREQPAEDAPVALEIHEGLVVSTLTRVGGWVLIQLPNGAQGWSESDGLGVI
jgi:tetratricopeptide (TPR) repeat protein